MVFIVVKELGLEPYSFRMLTLFWLSFNGECRVTFKLNKLGSYLYFQVKDNSKVVKENVWIVFHSSRFLCIPYTLMLLVLLLYSICTGYKHAEIYVTLLHISLKKSCKEDCAHSDNAKIQLRKKRGTISSIIKYVRRKPMHQDHSPCWMCKTLFINFAWFGTLSRVNPIVRIY